MNKSKDICILMNIQPKYYLRENRRWTEILCVEDVEGLKKEYGESAVKEVYVDMELPENFVKLLSAHIFLSTSAIFLLSERTPQEQLISEIINNIQNYPRARDVYQKHMQTIQWR